MQWLVHGNIARVVREALGRRGDRVHEAAALDLEAGAGAEALLEAARRHQWDLLTSDAAVAEAAGRLPRPFNRSIVLLLVEQDEVDQDDAVERLFARYRRLAPGRLYTVTGGRVKVRQLPQARRQ